MPKLKSADGLLKLVYSFRPIRIVLTAFELKVFSVIGEKEMTSGEIAKRTKTNTKGMDRLLNALCALGLSMEDGSWLRKVAPSTILEPILSERLNRVR